MKTGNTSRAAGMTLIEVMISLLILTAGLLGVSALHGLSIKSGTRAYYRSQAVNQAYDILERMRANPDGAANGAYALPADPGAAPKNCALSPCTGTELAGFDLAEWRRATASTLPAGAGSVSMQDSGVSVIVRWHETSGNDPIPRVLTVSTVARL